MSSKTLYLTCYKVACNDTACTTVDDYNVEHLITCVKLNFSLIYLIVQCRISTEKKLLTMYPDGQLDADLMKMPHHGWTSSNNANFVAEVSPQIAVATGAHELAIKIWKPYNTAKALVLEDLHDGYIYVAASSDGTMESETSK